MHLALKIMLCLALAPCAEATPGETRVYGMVWAVSRADLRAAVANYQSSPHPFGSQIDHIEVVSPSEMRFFDAPDYATYGVVRRIEGKWRFTGTVIVTE
jgi:hypothetical protein